MSTLDRVKALIADQVGIAASDINDDHDLKTIGMDSLDRVELAIAIEEHFNIDVDDHDTDSDEMSTPAKIAVYVDARLPQKAPEPTVERDMLVHGIGIEQDGKRIDPADFFANPADYAAMSDGDMLTAIGIDGMKWSDAFMQIACFDNPLGRALRQFPHTDKNNHSDMPEIMRGWFFNAIMAGWNAEKGEPITREELIRRGVAHNDEDEAMVMSVIAKLGWPRHDEPFGTEPTHELVEIPQVSNVAGCTFRKKPVTIEAVQFSGIVDGVPTFALAGIPAWLAEACGGPEGHQGSAWVTQADAGFGGGDWPGPVQFYIGTLEGKHVAQYGDWIIRGIAGEIYPCKPDIFARTYDAVEPAGEPTTGVQKIDIAAEMIAFEAVFPFSDHTKHRDGEVVAGRVRYAEPEVDKMFSAWLSAKADEFFTPAEART